MLILLVAAAIIAAYVVLGGRSGSSLAQAPPPTSTPISPTGAPVLTRDAVRRIALRQLDNAGTAVASSIVLEQHPVSAVPEAQISGHSADYPLWVVSASGVFRPDRWPAGVALMEFRRIVLFLDGVTGDVLGEEMSEPIAAPPTPTPAPTP